MQYHFFKRWNDFLNRWNFCSWITSCIQIPQYLTTHVKDVGCFMMKRSRSSVSLETNQLNLNAKSDATMIMFGNDSRKLPSPNCKCVADTIV